MTDGLGLGLATLTYLLTYARTITTSDHLYLMYNI